MTGPLFDRWRPGVRLKEKRFRRGQRQTSVMTALPDWQVLYAAALWSRWMPGGGALVKAAEIDIGATVDAAIR
jgi:hypothetical protein